LKLAKAMFIELTTEFDRSDVIDSTNDIRFRWTNKIEKPVSERTNFRLPFLCSQPEFRRVLFIRNFTYWYAILVKYIPL